MFHLRFSLLATLVIGFLVPSGCSHFRPDCDACSCEAVCEGVHSTAAQKGTIRSAPATSGSQHSSTMRYDGFAIPPAPAAIEDEINALQADNARLEREIDALSAGFPTR